MHRKRLIAAIIVPLALVFGFVGCQDYVFEPVLSGFISSRSVEEDIPVISKVDILFVVDDSGSMAGNQQNLANNLGEFMGMIEERNAERDGENLEPLDFQIAVASTSIVERMLLEGTLKDQDFYEIGSDNSYCLAGTAYDFTSGTPYPEGRFMAAPGNHEVLTSQHFFEDPDDALRQFQENIRLGTCGSSQEQGFEAMRRVLQENPDFFRDQSRLVVVFLADEEDCSDHTGEFISYIYQGGNLIDTRLHEDYRDALTPVSFYKTFLDELAAEKRGSVAVAAIISAVPGPEGPPHDMVAGVAHDEEEYRQWNCVDDECIAACPDWCNDVHCPRQCDREQREGESDEDYQASIDACWQACLASCPRNPRGSPCWCGGHTPGARYLELASMYGRDDHIMDEVCRPDFHDTLEDLVEIMEVDQCLGPVSPHDDDPSLILVRIEREGQDPIVCRPPEAPGEGACAEGADWYYDDENAQVCLCPDSECHLQQGDSYRLSVVEAACSPGNPC